MDAPSSDRRYVKRKMLQVCHEGGLEERLEAPEFQNNEARAAGVARE